MMTVNPPAEIRNRCITDQVISKDGTRIGYCQLGKGPGVILLHGGIESIHSHLQLAEALADFYTVYLPDRRGRGLSGPHGSNYCLQREIEDLDALLTKTDAHNVFGHSSGAIITLHAALVLSAIHKAVIFEPPFFNVTENWVPRFKKEMAEGKVASALVTSTKGTQMWGHTMPRWLLEFAVNRMMANEDRNAKNGQVTMRKLAPTFVYDAQLIVESKGLLERFSALQCDILLMEGSLSPSFLKAALDDLEKIIPHVQHAVIPGANHGAPGNNNMGGKPDLVAREMRRFFGSS